MADIIKLDACAPHQAIDEGEAHDRFLLEEGLELLAMFRKISNPATRSAISELVKRLADAEAGQKSHSTN